MSTFVFLLEEPSAKALLQGVLPRLIPSDIEIVYLVFEGKQDLEKNLARKLRGWRRPETSFVVLRDQDAMDCERVKARLVELVRESGRSALVRVACRELEAWVVGDLDALAKAFGDETLARGKNREKFRDPDSLRRPIEELQRLVPTYQKIDGARRVGPRLDPATNNSKSFRVFCAGIQQLLASGVA